MEQQKDGEKVYIGISAGKLETKMVQQQTLIFQPKT